ncbi:MAG: hypothetical protein OXB94_12405 [Nitrospira sp.]|nr:hypothetical protein [Nitrospira sp.]
MRRTFLLALCAVVFSATATPAQEGHGIPGVPFQVFLKQGQGETIPETVADGAVKTVVEAFGILVRDRSQHQRFDQALTNDLLQEVVIEPRVLNRDGKEFPFLVARTKQKGKVNLLINAMRLREDGYLGQPAALAPRLAKEFQWVISKAATNAARRGRLLKRDLKRAPIATNAEIKQMAPEERTETLQALLDTYIQTVDAYGSLVDQPYYEMGTTTLTKPEQVDSTIKLYDIRIRHALRLIASDPYFWDNTQKAVRSLLNGKVWHVLMAKIDERDWTTRTRVVPEDKAVTVGERGKVIQPAKILVNYHRAVEPKEELYRQTQGLPMGALSAEQLARVIAWEIQSQITEKSLRGHVAQDEQTAP